MKTSLLFLLYANAEEEEPVEIINFKSPKVSLENTNYTISWAVKIDKIKDNKKELFSQSYGCPIVESKDTIKCTKPTFSDSEVNLLYSFEYNVEGSDSITLNVTYTYFDEVKKDRTTKYKVHKEKITEIYGVLTLIPLVLLIATTYLLNQSLIALAVGIFSASVIVENGNPFYAFLRMLDEHILGGFYSEDSTKTFLFTFFLAGLIAVIQKSGGAKALVAKIISFATNKFKGSLATFFLSFIVFFDEFSTILIVGPNMLPVTDALKISREKLSLIVHALSSPLVVVMPISSWVGFELGLIKKYKGEFRFGEKSDYELFLSSITGRYFSFFFLFCVLVSILLQKDFGFMVKAEKNANEIESAEEAAEDDVLEPRKGIPLRSLNAIVPVIMLIVLTLCGLVYTAYSDPSPPSNFADIISKANILNSLLYASFFCIVLSVLAYALQGVSTVGESSSAFVRGVQDILEVILILIFANAFANVIKLLQTSTYVVSKVPGFLTGPSLPLMSFIITWAISFAIGSSWATCVVSYPLLTKIAALNLEGTPDEKAQVYINMIASIMSGAIVGEQMSPIGGINILVSSVCKLEISKHLKSQLYYVLTAAIFSILFGYLPLHLYHNSQHARWFNIAAIVVGCLLIIPFVWFFATPVDSDNHSLFYSLFWSKLKPKVNDQSAEELNAEDKSIN